MVLGFTDVDGNNQNDPIGGLADWAIYSSDGTTIELALEIDRRVRLQVIPTCIGDTDRNGDINVLDLINVILDWGCLDPLDPCPPLCGGGDSRSVSGGIPHAFWALGDRTGPGSCLQTGVVRSDTLSEWPHATAH